MEDVVMETLSYGDPLVSRWTKQCFVQSDHAFRTSTGGSQPQTNVVD